MREKIFLTYTNATALPYHGAVFAHHVVLNYIDANGKHHTLEGVPERKFNHNVEKLIAFSLEEGRPNGGIINTDSRFRRLRAKERMVTGRYRFGTCRSSTVQYPRARISGRRPASCTSWFCSMRR